MGSEAKIDLKRLLPKDQVLRAARELLSECRGRVGVDGEVLDVPTDSKLDLVETILHQTDLDIGFGTHVRAIVAIGGIQSTKNGIVVPGSCFAILYFSLEGDLITHDFLPASSWVR